MSWISEYNRDWYVSRMADHFKKSKEEIEKKLEKEPEALDDFVDYLIEAHEARKDRQMSKIGTQVIEELENQEISMDELIEKGLFNEDSKH